MTKQFKIGQVWADRVGCKWTILSTNNKQNPWYSVWARSENGYYADFCRGTGRFNITHHEDDEDLVTLIKDTEETVTNKLTPEPIPGHSYRTKDNSCVYYIGKTKRSIYLYEETDGDTLEYARPFQYWLADDDKNYDIVAPWTEPLPAVEIKRWARVQKTTETHWLRGHVHVLYEDKEKANDELNENEEIVELTGILPAREV